MIYLVFCESCVLLSEEADRRIELSRPRLASIVTFTITHTKLNSPHSLILSHIQLRGSRTTRLFPCRWMLSFSLSLPLSLCRLLSPPCWAEHRALLSVSSISVSLSLCFAVCACSSCLTLPVGAVHTYSDLFLTTNCLCCAVLCCAVLCCAVLCCAVLCCAVLCCAVLCCAVLCTVVLCFSRLSKSLTVPRGAG